MRCGCDRAFVNAQQSIWVSASLAFAETSLRAAFCEVRPSNSVRKTPVDTVPPNHSRRGNLPSMARPVQSGRIGDVSMAWIILTERHKDRVEPTGPTLHLAGHGWPDLAHGGVDCEAKEEGPRFGFFSREKNPPRGQRTQDATQDAARIRFCRRTAVRVRAELS
jgi:hypothetical protein